MSDDSDQVEYWNGDGGERWARHADRLDGMLAPFAREILDLADLQASEQVLDIGCGAGALTLEAARLVGAERGAVGVDVSAPLLDVARARADAQGLTARFVEASASAYRADIPVDAALSRFGVMFFADPVAAFAALRRNLRPEGRLVFACWQALSDNPWARAPMEAALPFLETPPERPDPHAPGPFAFADADRVRAILSESGWRGIAIAPWTGVLELPGVSAPETAAFMMELGPLARILQEAELDPAPVRAALETRLSDDADPDGRVRLQGAAWLVTATAS